MQKNNILNEEVVLLNHGLNIINGQKQQSFTNTAKKRQSAVCIIFRLNLNLKCSIQIGKINEYNRKEPDSFMNLITNTYEFQDGSTKNSLKHGIEMLFIKRADNPKDKFSGQVAFPGGKCDNEETDYEAAVREAFEECGLKLDDKSKYLYLGPIPKNFFVFPHPKGNLYVSAHIFWQINLEDIPMKTNPSEVAYCMWVPLNHIVNPPADCLSLSKDYTVKLPEGRNKVTKSITNYIASDLKGGKAWKILLPNGDDLWGLTFMILIYFMGFFEEVIKKKGLSSISPSRYNEIVSNCLHFKMGEVKGPISYLKIYLAEKFFYNYRQRQFENQKGNSYVLKLMILLLISVTILIYPRL